MKHVLFTQEMRQYFKDLVPVLYENKYFSFEEFAHDYVDKLFYDIKNSLPLHLHKPAPEYFNRYGKNMHYATFKKNKQTTWYAFFTKYNVSGETIFLVRYIANNHTVAQYL
ncbi:MAG: hypothetical protein LBU91_05310 [Bacteroidales bacterium]|jgi:hypothetical protein|nr:hypothetical protein [Bacteroidales bacterium]